MATPSNDEWVDDAADWKDEAVPDYHGHPNEDAHVNPHGPVAPRHLGSFGSKAADTVSDALPVTGALLGGAAGAATGPAAIGMIPLGGAGGYGIGELLKRYLDKASGRPGTPPPVNVLDSSMKGAREGMNAFSGGAILGRAASGLKDVGSLASEIGPAGNPFANLSEGTFAKLHAEAAKPARPILSAPRGDMAEVGAKFASPASAEAAQRGAQGLRRIAGPLEQDAAIGQAGDRGAQLDASANIAMRKNVTPLANASGNAIDKVSRALPPRPLEGSGQGPALPPGGDVVNQAFNAPGGQNSVIRDPSSMHAIADVKSLGLENRALGGVRKAGFLDAFKAQAQGISPERADMAGADAGELEALARTLQRQRGGIQQQGPSGFLPRTMYEAQKVIAGPRSQMMGLRAETPESALQNNSLRLAELEAAKRGLPSLSPEARDYAMSAHSRPLKDALTGPGGRAAGGATAAMIADLLRRYGGE